MANKNKLNILLLCALASGASYTSCSMLDSNSSETVVTDYSNPLITTFTLSANSNVCSNLSSYTFSIDQLGTTDPELIESFRDIWQKDEYSMIPGIIFNADSLPVGTIADSITVSMGYSSPSSVMIYQYDTEKNLMNAQNYGDTAAVYFDDYAYTRVELTAYDGYTNKSYFVKMNIHTTVGDTVVWKTYTPSLFETTSVIDQRVDTLGNTLCWFTTLSDNSQEVRTANLKGDITLWSEAESVSAAATLDLSTLYNWKGQLYCVTTTGALFTSADAKSWSEAASSYTFVNLLGAQLSTRKSNEYLCAIVQQGSEYHFASSEDGATWQLAMLNEGTSLLPEGFPVKHYTMPISTAAKPSLGNTTSRIYIVGGEKADGTLSSSTWSSDGSTWVEFPQNLLPAMKGACIALYTRDIDQPNSLWILQPGQMADGSVSKTLWFTENSGISWKKLEREYPEMADTYKIAPMACNSTFVNPVNYMIYLFGGIDADGKQQSCIVGGGYRNLEFWKNR